MERTSVMRHTSECCSHQVTLKDMISAHVMLEKIIPGGDRASPPRAHLPMHASVLELGLQQPWLRLAARIEYFLSLFCLCLRDTLPFLHQHRIQFRLHYGVHSERYQKHTPEEPARCCIPFSTPNTSHKGKEGRFTGCL
jgi:hypothetical protein